MRRIYGIKHVGIFTPLIILEDECFYFKNKQYAWDSILAIKRSDDIFSRFIRYPSTTILLGDGVILRIPAILQEIDKEKKYNSILLSNKNSAYEEVIDAFKKHSVSINKDLCKYLFSYNYIMVYRLIIIISLVFAIVLLLSIFALKIKYDFILLYFTILQLACMGTGIFMLIRRHLKEFAILQAIGKGDERK